jgi:carboxymethylenebutenolidase
MIGFSVRDRVGAGYLAVPEEEEGPGVLVLHAWWGLTPFFTDLCERLARAGFVAFAPDLSQGRTADTVEAAQKLKEKRDLPTMRLTLLEAVHYLRDHPDVRPGGLGVIGCCSGASAALSLAKVTPEDIAAVTVFYGSEETDFTKTRAAFL